MSSTVSTSAFSTSASHAAAATLPTRFLSPADVAELVASIGLPVCLGEMADAIAQDFLR